MNANKQMTLGMIVGNRGFFPDHLAKSGRQQMIQALEAAKVRVITLGENDSKYGAVETRPEARKCADLFRKHRDEIDGIVVTLPNFGDERAIADTLRMADLPVPVLVQATPDTPSKMTIRDRRDSFCGKMSACNNLMQYGIPYSLTAQHTVAPSSPEFRKDIDWFLSVCRVVKGMRRLRVGAIGARPAAFNTVRYSEKILEANGISVETLDLSEIMGRIARLKDSDACAQGKLGAIKKYVSTKGIPDEALMKMAKLGAVIDEWMQQTDVVISAIQCWTSLEEFFGVVPCTVMSMMSNEGLSSACEVDICGVIGMHALHLASGTPSALLDWNNNYADDPDKAVCFHCSNLPKHFFSEVRMDFQEIIAGTVGKENTFGTCVGQVRPSPMSFARLSTDDRNGVIRGYVGEGNFTNDPLQTFGGAGVVHISQLQNLLHFICENGFEHHVAANLSTSAAAVHEAATRYLGWNIHWHKS
ncbi:MAG TPA: L-fucose/L-arabinose isomerase family protein [Candidatus Acidoferrales bacterium]|nr:L-fucose/L-arabinose isomerase family protein [Candidatus Acidoferrales bacterium]